MLAPVLVESHLMRSPAILLIGFLLACGPVPPGSGSGDGSPPGAAPDLFSCGAADLTSLIGGPVTALPETGGWGALRIIHPGDAVTEDFSTARLNVEVDAQDRILRLSCG